MPKRTVRKRTRSEAALAGWVTRKRRIRADERRKALEAKEIRKNLRQEAREARILVEHEKYVQRQLRAIDRDERKERRAIQAESVDPKASARAKKGAETRRRNRLAREESDRRKRVKNLRRNGFQDKHRWNEVIKWRVAFLGPYAALMRGKNKDDFQILQHHIRSRSDAWKRFQDLGRKMALSPTEIRNAWFSPKVRRK